MKIVNKLELIAVFTTLSLAFVNQSAFSQHNGINELEKAQNRESETVVTQFKNKDTLLVSSQKLLNVKDSSIILPIPQPLGILCLLGMAGASSFLKLKIAKVKYDKKLEDKIETTKIEDKPVQMLNH
ncbi:MAG: hypothetical protein AB4062_03435 [Crocosphaera sp.]